MSLCKLQCVPEPNKVRGFFPVLYIFLLTQSSFYLCFYPNLSTFLSYRKKKKWKWKALSRVWLFVTPWTIPVHGIHRTINQLQQIGSAPGGVFVKEFNVTNFPFLRQLAIEGLLSSCNQFLSLHRVTMTRPHTQWRCLRSECLQADWTALFGCVFEGQFTIYTWWLYAWEQ